MKIVNKILVFIVFVFLLVVFVVIDFDILDVDGNGVISKSEVVVDVNIML